MIPEIAHFVLIMAVVLSVAGVVHPVVRRFAPHLYWPRIDSHIILLPFLILFSFCALVVLFVQDDFSVQYIAHNASSNLPIIYKLTAVWGAHEGSLLLWVLLLALMGATAIKLTVPRVVYHQVIPVYCLVCAGFLLLLLATSNPFLRFLPLVPEQGGDLNPLLQDPGFIIHPPILYMGYVGFALPFIFAINAKAFARHSIDWVPIARIWSLISFAFLTLGITLGSWWAYYELGWGGWWFWDPVENASFIPWLSGCALNHFLFLHSRTKNHEGFCVFLSIVTFIMCLIGTFLVRSGALTSVHAFAADPSRGMAILCFVTIMIGYSLIRFLNMMPFATFKSLPYKRGAGVLLACALLLTGCFTVFLGTLFPLVYESINNASISIGIPYFKKTFVPIAGLFMAVYLFTHVFSQTRYRIACLVLAALLIWGGSQLSHLFYVILAILAIYVCMFSLKEWLMCPTMLRLPVLLVHFGFGFAALGMVLTSTFSQEWEQEFALGESIQISNLSVSFVDVNTVMGPNYSAIKGRFLVQESNKTFTLSPEKRLYSAREMVLTETAIKPGFFRDIYISLGDAVDEHRFAVRVHVKPFVRWIWLGGIFIALGSLFRGIRLLRGSYVNG